MTSDDVSEDDRTSHGPPAPGPSGAPTDASDDGPGDDRGDDPAVEGKRRRGQDFPLAGFWRRGYDIGQVETFLHDAERALRAEPPAMAPYEVQDARFRGVRWRKGYDMETVDERMARLHDALRERHGDDSVGGIQGHESVRPHRLAFWIYVTGFVLVVLIVVFALTQML